MTESTGRAACWVGAGLLACALLRTDAREPPAERPPPRAGAARLLYGLPLDANREAAEVIELLPGIGPRRANALVAGRPYCALRDLERVAGIGPITLRGLAGRVAFPDLPPDCAHELRAEKH